MALTFYHSKTHGGFSIQSNKPSPPTFKKPYFIIFHDPDDCAEWWAIDGDNFPGGDEYFETFEAAEAFLIKTFSDIEKEE